VLPRAWRPAPYLKRLILQENTPRVITGPFKDLNYIRRSFSSALYPKILGLYERELHPVVDEIIEIRFDRVVDVGAAEGYYAIGLAMRCPGTSVVAFEMASEGQLLLREMAQLNGVSDRLEIRGFCNPRELTQALATKEGRHLLICDCEGYEEELLNLDQVPALRNTAILVELHEFISRGISQRIRARFEASHMIEEMWSEERQAKEFPLSTLYTRLMPQKYLAEFLFEYRPEAMNWFWMKPKQQQTSFDSEIAAKSP